MSSSEKVAEYLRQVGIPLFVYSLGEEDEEGVMHTFTTAYAVDVHSFYIKVILFEDGDCKANRIFVPSDSNKNDLEALYERWEEVRDTWCYEKDVTLDPGIEKFFGETSNTYEFCKMVDDLRGHGPDHYSYFASGEARAKAAGIPFFEYCKTRLNGSFSNCFFVFHNEEKPKITVRIYDFGKEEVFTLENYFGAAKNSKQLLAGLRQEIIEQQENPFISKGIPLSDEIKEALYNANDIDEFYNKLKNIYRDLDKAQEHNL